MKNQSFSTHFQLKWHQIWSFSVKNCSKVSKNCCFIHVPTSLHHFSHHFHIILRYMWCRYIIWQWNYTMKFTANLYLHHLRYTSLRYMIWVKNPQTINWLSIIPYLDWTSKPSLFCMYLKMYLKLYLHHKSFSF